MLCSSYHELDARWTPIRIRLTSSGCWPSEPSRAGRSADLTKKASFCHRVESRNDVATDPSPGGSTVLVERDLQIALKRVGNQVLGRKSCSEGESQTRHIRARATKIGRRHPLKPVRRVPIVMLPNPHNLHWIDFKHTLRTWKSSRIRPQNSRHFCIQLQ